MNHIQKDLERIHDLINQHPSLCMAPWKTIDFRHEDRSGQKIHTTCCCNLDTTIFKADYSNDTFKEIKQQQEVGQWPLSCWRCKTDEDNGGQSERKRFFIQFDQNNVLDFVHNRKINEFEVRVKFSNFCNLSCRSCAATESSTFAKITNATYSAKQSQDITDDPAYWTAITNSILDLHSQYDSFVVHGIGGETLVQPGMKKLLAWIVEQGFAAKIGVRFTTALSTNPAPDFLDILTKFRWVDIVLSIDSVGENYHYVRWPAQFDKIDSNLNSLIDYKPHIHIVDNKQVPMVRWLLHVSPVFSLNNFYYMHDWLDYWNARFQKQGYSFNMFVATLTEQTKYLDIEALPWQYRPSLKAYLTQCLGHEIFMHWPTLHVRGVYNFISTTIKELDLRYDDVLWRRYLTLTAWFDEKTKRESAVYNARFWQQLQAQDLELYHLQRNYVRDTAIPQNLRLHNILYKMKPKLTD